ncbi:GNAT family N-acetyltransferase [Paucibacter sp. XJ19-41]|uniref:GNAT family N-acetyltransferase n=1 Tax=Paucibacter sp. XJ19-41 TaxID=2927824 RepID=UPI00234B2BFD|nr:GNAT family N-acetyltransferase [Paucibacter sp. XJ19-41]MDC6166494.1 GNAT family N-acetyltransferase [Paucibacter sp. XJ19-41]
MNGHIALRAATPADAAEIAQLYLCSRRHFLPYAPLAHSDEEVKHWMREHLLPSAQVTVAQEGGELLGFIASTEGDACRWVDHLYLRPAWVGLGIGSALLRPLIAGQTRDLRLYTFQQNLGARRFYERFGFVAIAFTDGSGNEERCPDVLYERPAAAMPR